MKFNSSARPRSLYIHWPFCPYKCHFCPFVALAGHDQFMEQYHVALKKEIAAYAELPQEKLIIDTVYIGGGTPSTYPNELLLDMFDTLKNTFHFSDDNEVTLEVNPGTVTIEKLLVWHKAGINRLSVGVQSLKDSALTAMNRHQSRDDVLFVIQEGSLVFDNISIDMILGLPDVSHEEWKQFLQELMQMPIQHISIYFLTVHEDTPLYFKVKKQKVSLPCDDSLIDLYNWSVDLLAQHGFHRYELSNFAKVGRESRHNSVYWERKPYKAFGIGACGFDGNTRFQNEKNLMKYIKNMHENQDAVVTAELLTPEQIYIEKVMLGLRQAKGICVEELQEHLSHEERSHLITKIAWLKNNGFMEEYNNRLILTPRGLSVENNIALQLAL